MPSFTITLHKKNTVYNLYDEINSQIELEDPRIPISSQWPYVSFQASLDNKVGDEDAPIKFSTDSSLSGLRYGRVMKPGDIRELFLGGSKFVSTRGLYFLCETMDGAQISVDLVGSVYPEGLP